MGESKGLSLHIGLNRIDPSHYGIDGMLSGCENDAHAMCKIADDEGFDATTLLNESATSTSVVGGIVAAAGKMSRGDIFLLTYAGHGSQVPDASGDELEDHRDETWCLYDRMLLDDELHACWSQFPAGSRIVVISDSCHNGTVARMLAQSSVESSLMSLNRSLGQPTTVGTPRVLPLEIGQQVFVKHADVYQARRSLGSTLQPVQASVLLISGCQDNQTSGDGPTNGVFTTSLLKVWARGVFSGSYRLFHRKIQELMPPLQTPNYYFVGVPNRDFEAQRPFTIPVTTTGGQKQMDLDLDPRIVALLNRGSPSLPTGQRLVMGDGGCTISIGFNRTLLDGLTDEQTLTFFQSQVAPLMMDNWLRAQAAVNRSRTRGGSVSCTVGSGGGGSVSCTGSWSF